jgi:hypothetical protein
MEHRNKLNKLVLVLILMGSVFGISGCYYDNEEYLYPASAECTTENMSFASDVWPVINASCTGCHSGSSPSGNVSLENYAGVAAAAAIDAGNYGSLYGTISHASGNSPMPKGGSKLSDCTIAKIKAWIDQGALDN